MKLYVDNEYGNGRNDLLFVMDNGNVFFIDWEEPHDVLVTDVDYLTAHSEYLEEL